MLMQHAEAVVLPRMRRAWVAGIRRDGSRGGCSGLGARHRLACRDAGASPCGAQWHDHCSLRDGSRPVPAAWPADDRLRAGIDQSGAPARRIHRTERDRAGRDLHPQTDRVLPALTRSVVRGHADLGRLDIVMRRAEFAGDPDPPIVTHHVAALLIGEPGQHRNDALPRTAAALDHRLGLETRTPRSWNSRYSSSSLVSVGSSNSWSSTVSTSERASTQASSS